MSRAGIIAALLYLIPATYFLVDEARHPSGGWINLRTLLPALLTCPISFPLEWLGMLPDLNKSSNVAVLVLACAALIYFVTATIANWFTSR